MNDLKIKILLCFICLCLLSSPTIWAKPTNPIHIQTMVQSTLSWDKSELPAYPKGQPEVTILKITIQPGGKLPMHRHPVINAGVMLKGEITVNTEDGKTLVLKAGDPIVELVDKWHYGESSGTEPAEIIVFYAGIQGKPFTVKK